MTATIDHFEPSTAREVLAAFFPSHADHTVIRCRSSPSSIDLICGCGSTVLKVFERDLQMRGWAHKRVDYALRNVPLEPKVA